MVYKVICPTCGKEFEVTNRSVKYCSHECRYKANREAWRRQHEKQKLQREAKRQQKAEELEYKNDHRYDWLKKFDPIVKEALRTGSSYGKTVAKNR